MSTNQPDHDPSSSLQTPLPQAPVQEAKKEELPASDSLCPTGLPNSRVLPIAPIQPKNTRKVQKKFKPCNCENRYATPIYISLPIMQSKCIKLYCECFANGIFCSPACNCKNCLNTKERTADTQKLNKSEANEVVGVTRSTRSRGARPPKRAAPARSPLA